MHCVATPDADALTVQAIWLIGVAVHMRLIDRSTPCEPNTVGALIVPDANRRSKARQHCTVPRLRIEHKGVFQSIATSRRSNQCAAMTYMPP
jgi:hypothetical protein